MPTPSSDLLRAGLALKLSHIQRATRSYLRDRTNQASATIIGYAVAVGLFGVAGVFFLSACFVGATALFRWIEINHGLFPAFGALGGLLLVAAVICAALAVIFLKRPPPQFPSLSSRMRVAINANPTDHIQSVLNTTSANVRSGTVRQIKSGLSSGLAGKQFSAGLILIATMLGWAAARKRRQARQHAAPDGMS